MSPCQWSTCERTDVRLYLTGQRCPDHTPAALAGRPEPPVGDPLRSYVPAPLSATTLIDNRAIASGKRRANRQRIKEAKEALGQ